MEQQHRIPAHWIVAILLASTLVGPATPARSSADPWSEITARLDAFPVEDMAFVVGDENGVLFSYEKGQFPFFQAHRLASASKWLSSATLFRLVEQGVLSLEDHPQDFIPWWTDDTADPRSHITLRHLMSFTSGLSVGPTAGSCIGDGSITLEECVQELYDGGLTTFPGDEFYYGPAHLQVAALMAQIATGEDYALLFRDGLADPLALSLATAFLFPSTTNPRAAGGAISSVDDYAEFLRAMLADEVIADMDTFLADRTADPVVIGYRPDAVTLTGFDWHYGLGFWRQCDAAVWADSCASSVIASSAGAFGWTPWIDFETGYFALIAMDEGITGIFQPAVESVALQLELQPIVEALLNPATPVPAFSEAGLAALAACLAVAGAALNRRPWGKRRPRR